MAQWSLTTPEGHFIDIWRKLEREAQDYKLELIAHFAHGKRTYEVRETRQRKLKTPDPVPLSIDD